jgi:hypothetical protein
MQLITMEIVENHSSLIVDIFPRDIFLLVNEYIIGKEYYYNKYTKLYHRRFSVSNAIYNAIDKLYQTVKIIKNVETNTMTIMYGASLDLPPQFIGVMEYVYTVKHTTSIIPGHTVNVKGELMKLETNSIIKHKWDTTSKTELFDYYVTLYHRTVYGKYVAPLRL